MVADEEGNAEVADSGLGAGLVVDFSQGGERAAIDHIMRKQGSCCIASTQPACPCCGD